VRCQAVRRRLADQAPADVRQLRLAAPDDEDWGLTILISRIEPSPDQLNRLLGLAEDGPGGIAALVAGDPETADGRMAPTVLQLAPDPQQPAGMLANVIPLQIMVRPQVLSDAEYAAISTLFATAADLHDVSPTQAPYEIYGAPPWIPQAAAMRPGAERESSSTVAGLLTQERGYAAGPQGEGGGEGEAEAWAEGEAGADDDDELGGEGQFERLAWHDASEFAGSQWPSPVEPAHRLEVKILGSFVITGAADQLQPKQAELVLALALAAPGGLTNSALCSMLGEDPDHPKPSDAVRQIITRARRRLGQASDGQEYVIHTGNGNYVLHPDVSLDWTEFRNLTATARAADIRTALSLVRGQPFTGSYYWWIDIPLLETVRAEIPFPPPPPPSPPEPG
jgi:hypothetical protein